MAYIIACAVRMPLPRLAAGVGHCFYNSLRCARACLGLRSGWGIAYINSLRCARVCLGWLPGGARCHEMLRPKGSLGLMAKVIS